MGGVKINLSDFLEALKIPFSLKSLDYLTSYLALSKGMGFEGNPFMAYLISVHPALMLVGLLIIAVNIYILVRMYSRHTQTVLFCYYLIIGTNLFLVVRNILYMALWLTFR